MKTGWSIAAIVALMLAGIASAEISEKSFVHHFITTSIPQNAQSLNYGTPALADFDKDGDLDFAVCTTRETLFWFENTGGRGEWTRHVVGPIPITQLGSCVMDVDGDGWMDIVTGGMWYRNSQRPKEAQFTRYTYDPKIKAEIHDMVVADVDGDGRRDVVALGDREGCFWYAVPANPLEDRPWQRTLITDLVLDQKDDMHGGFSPGGVADLDGDGDVDLVLPNRWMENAQKGKQWIQHPLPFGKKGPWGLSSRSWIADIDKDGDKDIVIVDCDQKDSRAAWLESSGGKQPTFNVHWLPRTAPGVRGSFHSLAVADFDGDGDLDVATVEQEDPTILPERATPRWYIWENLDGKAGQFAERVILDAKLGGHDIQIGDIDGDGDLDIASKIWRLWDGNANGGRFHADWMENRAK